MDTKDYGVEWEKRALLVRQLIDGVLAYEEGWAGIALTFSSGNRIDIGITGDEVRLNLESEDGYLTTFHTPGTLMAGVLWGDIVIHSKNSRSPSMSIDLCDLKGIYIHREDWCPYTDGVACLKWEKRFVRDMTESLEQFCEVVRDRRTYSPDEKVPEPDEDEDEDCEEDW